MSSNSSNNVELSGELSLLNIGSGNESNNEEKEAITKINSVVLCANCGKEGDGDSMNTCNKCDLVKYCNAACKKKHKSKHKKKCERRVAELYDEKLFKVPPPPEECPICFLTLPLDRGGVIFESCCGKMICRGCIDAMIEREGAKLCAFCRTPDPNSDKEEVERLEKLTEKSNARAFYNLAGCYAEGSMGMPQNWAKANELFLKAGELGCAEAYFNLGNAHDNGMGVEVDEEKAKYYYELAAIGGNVKARYNLGYMEVQAANPHRAMKHFILAAKTGDDKALGAVKLGFMNGVVTKDEYANTLREYQKSQDEMKSEARDKAEAYHNL